MQEANWTRSQTPFLKKPQKTFMKNIRFPSVKLEGEHFSTCITEPSQNATSPIPNKKKHIFRAIKIAKAIHTVDLLESFEEHKQKIKKRKKAKPIGFKLLATSPIRNLSIDSKISRSEKNEKNIKKLFKAIMVEPKKVISDLRCSQFYVKKKNSSRENINLRSATANSAQHRSIINYYY